MTASPVGYRAGMAHLPINHVARPVLRVVEAGIGLFILTFGIVGLVVTWGLPFFDREANFVFGLRTNPAFSILSIAAGVVFIAAAVYGHNLDHFVGLVGGAVFLLAGLIMMSVLHTEANLLNFGMTNCTTSLLIGFALVTTGLYSKSGSEDEAEEEDRFRHGGVGREEYAERIHTQAGPKLPDASDRSGT